ncbi:DUF5958 family protein [Streptomyces yanii]|uniref:DUF5958 family protein n=1 Tax=Streptomyces yanii TaxID=78510 RepID=A0ABV5RIX1_9ACTN
MPRRDPRRPAQLHRSPGRRPSAGRLNPAQHGARNSRRDSPVRRLFRASSRSATRGSPQYDHARVTEEDAPHHCPGRADLRPTHTPAVLITRGRINDQLGKIASLTPRDERRKAFRLLVAVLAIADGRRRERYCSNGCGHWWHRLSAAD